LASLITRHERQSNLTKKRPDKRGLSINPKKETLKKIISRKDVDIMEGLRKFANKDNLLVAKALQKSSPRTLSELRSITGINTNDLNHRLGTLRNADIVSKVDSKYALTIYGAVLIGAYFEIEASLEIIIQYGLPLFGDYYPNRETVGSLVYFKKLGSQD
jgi:predicted transcriptional regulator